MPHALAYGAYKPPTLKCFRPSRVVDSDSESVEGTEERSYEHKTSEELVEELVCMP